MATYEVLVTISGWGRTFIEADNEQEARAKFHAGEYTMSKEDVSYDFEDIEEVT